MEVYYAQTSPFDQTKDIIIIKDFSPAGSEDEYTDALEQIALNVKTTLTVKASYEYEHFFELKGSFFERMDDQIIQSINNLGNDDLRMLLNNKTFREITSESVGKGASFGTFILEYNMAAYENDSL